MRYKVRATCQELRTPGGSKEVREWEGCLAHCSARCTPRGNQRRGAGQGERGRADRGRDRAKGPGHRGGAERERCLANCSAPCSRWPEGRGSEMAGQGRGRAARGPAYAHSMPRRLERANMGQEHKRCPTTERAARSARGHWTRRGAAACCHKAARPQRCSVLRACVLSCNEDRKDEGRGHGQGERGRTFRRRAKAGQPPLSFLPLVRSL